MRDFWWQLTSDYWDLPFFSDFGLCPIPEHDEALAAREQLFAMRELPEDALPFERRPDPVQPDMI